MVHPIRYLVVLVVVTVYYGLKVIIAGFLRLPNRPGGLYDEAGRRWSRGLLWGAGVEVHAVGFEHVPPGQMRFVAKREMAKIPILGAAMKAAGQIFIDRQNRARAFEAYEEAAQAVNAGLNAVVFAEGTRSRTGELQSFKKGPFVFAIASQVPIVPVYCAGTFDILRKGSIWVRPHPITLYFGEPIPTAGLTYEDREALLERTRAVIMGFRIDAGEEER
jgi:1-acyl-sn-glycerol-3-phosphate acyltransferase